MSRQLCLLAALLPSSLARMLSNTEVVPAPPPYQADLCSTNRTAAALAAAQWWSDPANAPMRAQGRRFECPADQATPLSVPLVLCVVLLGAHATTSGSDALILCSIVALCMGLLGLARLAQLALRR